MINNSLSNKTKTITDSKSYDSSHVFIIENPIMYVVMLMILDKYNINHNRVHIAYLRKSEFLTNGMFPVIDYNEFWFDKYITKFFRISLKGKRIRSKLNKKKQSLHTFNKKNIESNEYLLKHKLWLKRNLIKKAHYKDIKSCNDFVEKIYEKGYNGMDIIDIIDNEKTIDKKNKHLYLIYFDKIRSEYRNEKLFIFAILNIYFMRKNLNLENILEM